MVEVDLSGSVVVKLVNKFSSIRSFDLVMKDGLLRVEGRLRYVSIKVDVRNFIIL